MGAHIDGQDTAVKTTIDIADDLISRAKLVQKRDGVTLRALVEDGLRLRARSRSFAGRRYRFAPIVAGKPFRSGTSTPDVNASDRRGERTRVHRTRSPWRRGVERDLHGAQAANTPARKKARRAQGNDRRRHESARLRPSRGHAAACCRRRGVARCWPRAASRGRFAWPSVHEFFAVVTHARHSSTPSTPRLAWLAISQYRRFAEPAA